MIEQEARFVVPSGSLAAAETAGPAAGIDLMEIDRIAATLRRYDQRFLDRVYTPREQRYCGGRVERLAGRFAAKEAVSKVLGIGMRRIRWRDIEVLPDARGKPEVFLHGHASEIGRRRHIHVISVSITHSRAMAAAVAVGWRGDIRADWATDKDEDVT